MSSPIDELIEDLRAEIARGQVLAIVGSGVSLSATKNHPHASWTGLIESGVDWCLAFARPLPDGWEGRVRGEILSGDLDEFLSAAEKVSRRLGAPRGGEFGRWLDKTVGALRLEDRTVLEALQGLGVVLATTNYDGLIEQATGLRAVTWLHGGKVERVLRGEDRGVLHLHGYWEEPESVILGIRSYEAVTQDQHAQTVLRALRTLRTLLFVGCGPGLADPNLGAFLRWSRAVFRGSGARHFRLCLAGEMDQVQAMHPPEERIFAVPYGRGYDELAGFLRSLSPSAGALATLSRTPPVAADPAPKVLARPGILRAALDRWLPGRHLSLTRTGTLSEPPERAVIAKQLADLWAKIRSEPWTRTYLPLAGRAEPADREAFEAPIRQILQQVVGRSQGGDSASPQIAAANRRGRVARDLLRLIDRAEVPLVLLGEPGSGKTVTLQYAAMTLAARESRRVFPRAVLYLRLGEFHVEGAGRIGADDVLRYVERASPPALRPWIGPLLEVGRAVLFFDGMDEMSRDRYGDHTAALSLFAAATPAKTLFSCRSADFSSRFLHERLVLLPFELPQVAEFLGKYIKGPLEVDGRRWPVQALARHITRGDLAMQANTPFVLWLLSLYLLETGRWPDSRVQLLRFYNEANYGRKAAEPAENESPLPAMETAFRGWAGLAYRITERNRGAEIPVHLFAASRDPAEVGEILRAGKRCNVLVESGEGPEHSVEFKHHRFQEYFAAWHIREERPEIDWLDRLDAPRWQETLLNLILLGDDGGAARALAGSIDDLAQAGATGRREEPWSFEESAEEPPLDDEVEALLADRVELCSRVLRQGSAAPGARETLAAPFLDAVQLLARRGNPITQVKMMRVCLNVPDVDRIEVLRQPLHSPIRWVRTQALIVLAGLRGKRAVGSDLATEMGYDLANGLFPSRLPAYFKAVRKAGDPGHWWTLWTGSVCFALNMLLLLSMATAIYCAAWSLRGVTVDLQPVDEGIHHAMKSWPWQRPFTKPPSAIGPEKEPEESPIYSLRGYGVLSQRGFVATSLLFVLFAVGVALKLNPSSFWMVIPGSAAAIALVGPVLLCLGTGSIELGRASITFSTLFLPPAPLAAALIAAAIHFGSLAIFLVATARLRHSGHSPWAFLSSGWRNGGFGKAIGWHSLALSLIVPALLLATALGFMAFATVDYFLNLPLDPLGRYLIIVGVPLLIFLGVPLVRLGLHLPTRTLGKGLLGFLGGLVALGLATWLLGNLMLWTRKLPPIERARIVAIFCIVSLATITVLLSHLSLRRFWSFLTRQVRRPAQPAAGISIHPDSWKMEIRAADAHQQKILLARTGPQALSISPAQFLELLWEIRSSIKEEPALSAYWDRRDRLEQSLRQERQG